MKQSLFVFIIFICMKVHAQVSIIPAPVNASLSSKKFSLSSTTSIVLTDEGEMNTASFFNDYLQKFYGFKLPVKNRNAADKTNIILLTTKKFIRAPDNEEAYMLNISNNTINIVGDSYHGTFNGMQSLIQLLPAPALKAVKTPRKLSAAKSLLIQGATINDYPRFRYRGMHLDVSRHFFSIDYIKKYIDFLALHKLNTFHWHLTDDQGWRIEIKKYPRLTQVGGYRNGTIIGRYPGKGNDSMRYGGYYTQQQVKEVIDYAANRFITVIPEIEMPGHASAAIAAYPVLSCFPEESTKAPAGTAWSGTTTGKQVQQAWGVFPDVFCAGSETTFQILEDVLSEVTELFPSTYIHIGGDECPKDNWKRCPRCQQRIKELKLKDEHELQSYFIQRIEKFVNSKGKKIIGWDEILEGGIAPNATVMSWRGEQGGIDAAKQKHNAIMTPEPYLYLNWSQTKNEDSVSFGRYTPIEKVYSYEPIPKALDSVYSNYILGTQANLWTEYINNTSILEYNLLPRLSALSEVAWSPKNNRSYNDFEKRLMQQFKRYDLWKAHYSKADFDIKDSVAAAPGKGLLWYLSSNVKGARINYSVVPSSNKNIQSKSLHSVQTKMPALITQSSIATANLIYNGDNYFKTFTRSFSINKATGKKITLKDAASSTYPGNGGAFGLVNGLTGKEFNSQEFQGWFGKNMEAVIDLGEQQNISTVGINVWKQEPSFIYLPKAVEVYTSTDGSNWQKILTQTNADKPWPNERKITVKLPQQTRTQYIKVVAVAHGIIEAGKPDEGRNTWLFVDEIEVE